MPKVEPSNYAFVQSVHRIMKEHQMGLISDDECANKIIEASVNHLEQSDD